MMVARWPGRKAEADLAQARWASTCEEMQQRLQDMMVAPGHPAGPSVAVEPPEQHGMPLHSGVLHSVVAVVPLQQEGSPGLPRKRLCGEQRLRDMMVASRQLEGGWTDNKDDDNDVDKEDDDLACLRRGHESVLDGSCDESSVVVSAVPAVPLVAVGSPEQAPAAPSMAVVPAGSSVPIVPLQQVGAPGLPRKRLRGKSLTKAFCTIQCGVTPWHGKS